MALGCAYCVYGRMVMPPDTVFYLGRDTFKTPVYAFYGKAKGPVMILDAGIHGDEIAGQIATDSIVKHIKIEEGTLYIIPRVNRLAALDSTRFLNVDLNRTFPGDTCWVDYEYTLSYLFMQLIDSIKPNLVINLHEARSHLNIKTIKNKDKMAFGQTLITIEEPYSPYLQSVLDSVNTQITAAFTTPFKKGKLIYGRKFKLHRFPFMAAGSLDNIYLRLKINSYTVETWRGYDLPDRVNMQMIISLEFMRQLGLKFNMNN